MSARIMAQAVRRCEISAGEERPGQSAAPLASLSDRCNSVVLLELRDELGGCPTLYILTVTVHLRSGRLVHWSRTETDATVAREAYDQSVLDHISVEAA